MSVPHRIEWMFEDGLDAILVNSESKRVQIPLPPEIGVGYTEHVDLFDNVEIIRQEIQFKGSNRPPELSLGRFNTVYPSSTIAVNTVHSGRFQLFYEDHQLNRVPGTDAFARFQEFEITQVLNTDKDLSISNLVVPQLSLYNLMGEEAAQVLFENLGLIKLGSFKEVQIPKSISSKIEDCVPENLSGKMRSLFGQSIIMQYFLELNLHTLAKQGFLNIEDRDTSLAKAIHTDLLNVTGNIPSLTELAKKYGYAASRLNALYFRNYNETIYTFLSNQRLYQAYEALEKTSIPMKVLANRIGYSHVNHFITAFKKKFGVTPGSIRKS